MGSASNAYENKLLDAILGPGFTKDATVYVAVCTTAPSDTALGTEPSGLNYARVAVVNNATNWPAATNGQKSNGVDITFPVAYGAWGLLTHWMIMNDATGTAASNMIAWGTLAAQLNVVVMDAPRFPVGALVLTAD